jgi:hypothetical protein
MGYVQKTNTSAKQLIPVTKEGIKEHFLAIITTCDLVSNIVILMLQILIRHFDTRFTLWNVQLSKGSSLT